MNQHNAIISNSIKIIAIISSIYGIIRTVEDLMGFSYFTTLSNVFIDIVLFSSLTLDSKSRNSFTEKSYKSNMWYTVKYMATISITATFMIYLFILAPTHEGGFLYAYFVNGAGSLCVHFITPILAIADFFLYDYEYKSNKFHALYAMVPPFVYLLFVLFGANVLGWRWGDMVAPYNFINYGAPTGWFGFDLSLMSDKTLGIGAFYMIVLLFAIFIVIGEIYLVIKDIIRKHKIQELSEDKGEVV